MVEVANPNNSLLVVVQASQSGEKNVTPDWSPDGKKIAYTQNLSGQPANIYVADATAPGPTENLTSDNPGSTDTAPVWSPDGTKIAFVSKRDGHDCHNNPTKPCGEIYTMGANGDDPTNISNTPGSEESMPDWQPVEAPDPVLPPEPDPSAPANTVAGPNPTSEVTAPASGQKLTASAYKKACNLRISGLSFKKAKRRYSKTKETITLKKVSKKTVRRYLTVHGFKGVVKYGNVNGKPVKCKSVRMLVLQKRGTRYYIPGTKIKVSGKRLHRDAFAKKAVGYLKKRKIGRLRLKSRSGASSFSYKNFNSKTKLGSKAIKSLRRSKYRVTYSLFYVAKVNGKLIQKEIRITSSNK